jgi:carboxyl-terminal processing protease
MNQVLGSAQQKQVSSRGRAARRGRLATQKTPRRHLLLLGVTLFLGSALFLSSPKAAWAAAEAKVGAETVEAEVLPRADAKLEEIYGDLETFADTLAIIENHYVDPVTPRKLVYGAMNGMLASLDPYSQFLEPAAHDAIRQETEGRFGGIGVEIAVREGVLSVVTALDDTPAFLAGLQPEDKIVKINGEATRDLMLDEAVKMLRGEPGTAVRLSVMRDGVPQILELELKRAVIKVKSVKRAGFIEDGIAYIRITEFQENTPVDFKKAITGLEKKGLSGLIIDMRNNPGGLFPESVKLAETFVPANRMIVSTKGRTADQNADYLSSGDAEPKAYPIAVLVNRGTASAAEIVAGALQDHGLAILIGTRTFGKGSVQTVIPMKDGSAVRMTTSRYYTPSGRMIHGEGIQPDIEVAYEPVVEAPPQDSPGEHPKVLEMFDQVESVVDARKIPPAPVTLETIRRRDNQVRRAIDILKGIDIYGSQKTIKS